MTRAGLGRSARTENVIRGKAELINFVGYYNFNISDVNYMVNVRMEHVSV